jgi:hypothetical protein
MAKALAASTGGNFTRTTPAMVLLNLWFTLCSGLLRTSSNLGSCADTKRSSSACNIVGVNR